MGNLCSADDNTTSGKKSKISNESFKRVIGHHGIRQRRENVRRENELCSAWIPISTT